MQNYPYVQNLHIRVIHIISPFLLNDDKIKLNCRIIVIIDGIIIA